LEKRISNKQGVNLELIKRLRIQRQMSQADMASVLGFKSPDKYTRREIGEYSIQTDELLKISKLFHEPMENFFVFDVRK